MFVYFTCFTIKILERKLAFLKSYKNLGSCTKQTQHLLLIVNLRYYFPESAYRIYTVGKLKDWTKRNLWSKTTLISNSVSGAAVNPPFCKMITFFLRSLGLSVSIYRNFQSNGGKWRSHKLWIKKFIKYLII